ncbi:MAG TPA: nucleoside triphosphate pyrophosphohydrolase, partial [Rhizobiales bacterium]|nr:nucleoside triphosphate pyrophosphohydrolase [Hyphomicrobiales bacterium]
DKMLRRHPHVFGTEEQRKKGATREDWERIKAQERATKKRKMRMHGLLDDVPNALPALMRAEKLQKRAARVGFDWPKIQPVYDKVQEEILEVKAASKTGDPEQITDEMGDLLFSCVNLARHLGVDPEMALRGANEKFTRRFTRIENSLHEQEQQISDLGPKELDALWERVKLD